MKIKYLALLMIVLMIALVTAKKERKTQKSIKNGKNQNKKSNKQQTHTQNIILQEITKPDYPSMKSKKMIEKQNIQKPQYPSIKRNKNNTLSKNKHSQNKTNQNQQDQTNIFFQTGKHTIIGSGATLVANAASAAAISSAGFTTGGISAGSIAAGVQSGIGLVKAGSAFSYLQAFGALGQGVLGAYALPAVVGVGAVYGGYVLYNQLTKQK